MSDPIIKGVKRPAARTHARSASPAASAKSRKLSAKSARPKPLAKRPTAKKAPVRKATKAAAPTAKNTRPPAKKSAASKSTATKLKRTAPPKKSSAPSRKASKPSSKTSARHAAKPQPKRTTTAPATKAAAKPQPKRPTAPTRHVSQPRQPTQDETAALRAFERAHREFARGRFSEARLLFRQLIEQHTGVAEVTARARTYLAIAEARLRSESALPRSAEELYDRGVIELNRGEYVAAQEMFERALRREPEAAHIHYGLAATRARLGSVDLALQSLERALQLQPNLRLRAQHDIDLSLLRNDPEYDRIVFAPRP
jgi:tetratricopeptide (TPR) repeat protein